MQRVGGGYTRQLASFERVQVTLFMEVTAVCIARQCRTRAKELYPLGNKDYIRKQPVSHIHQSLFRIPPATSRNPTNPSTPGAGKKTVPKPIAYVGISASKNSQASLPTHSPCSYPREPDTKPAFSPHLPSGRVEQLSASRGGAHTE
jgi:hypothetical protein